jgi:hypothetical protein
MEDHSENSTKKMLLAIGPQYGNVKVAPKLKKKLFQQNRRTDYFITVQFKKFM